MGEQLCALEAIQAPMIFRGRMKGPVTAKEGGRSVGDPRAGQRSNVVKMNTVLVSEVDRHGARAVTAVLVIFVLAFSVWISV